MTTSYSLFQVRCPYYMIYYLLPLTCNKSSKQVYLSVPVCMCVWHCVYVCLTVSHTAQWWALLPHSPTTEPLFHVHSDTLCMCVHTCVYVCLTVSHAAQWRTLCPHSPTTEHLFRAHPDPIGIPTDRRAGWGCVRHRGTNSGANTGTERGIGSDSGTDTGRHAAGCNQMRQRTIAGHQWTM